MIKKERDDIEKNKLLKHGKNWVLMKLFNKMSVMI